MCCLRASNSFADVARTLGLLPWSREFLAVFSTGATVVDVDDGRGIGLCLFCLALGEPRAKSIDHRRRCVIRVGPGDLPLQSANLVDEFEHQIGLGVCEDSDRIDESSESAVSSQVREPRIEVLPGQRPTEFVE